MEKPRIVSREAWLEARRVHLAHEKQLTRMRDELLAERRALPRVRIEKSYVFEGPEGPLTLAELFDGRSQLVVQHFMLGPGWGAGCVGCSFEADHMDATLVHLEHHDVSYARVSRAPITEIEAYRRRMGWRARWVSSYGSAFNHDFHVSFTEEELAGGRAVYNFETIDPGIDELPGISVFCRDEAGEVLHAYSSYGRGNEELIGTYMVLDLTPGGRNENGPHRNLMDWVKRHDEYDDA